MTSYSFVAFVYCSICKKKTRHYTNNNKKYWKTRTIWCDECFFVKKQISKNDLCDIE